MNRPWKIWMTFVTCLAVIAAVMTWLSVMTWRLDAFRETDRVQTELARREAELQDRINSALYRMDLMMLPVIAQEAARPPSHYFHGSPVLANTPPFIRQHFQINSDDTITSPQARNAQLDSLINAVKYKPLLAMIRPTDVEMQSPALSVATGVANAYGVPSAVLTPEDTDSDGKLAVQQLRVSQRGNAEYQNRRESTNGFANFQMANNSICSADSITDVGNAGTMRPVWVDDNLLLLRLVAWEGEIVIQGCWMDWSKIKLTLLGKVKDLVADADLQPQLNLAQSDASRSLTTLPLQLSIDEPAALAALAIDSYTSRPVRSGLQGSLLIAWLALALAAFGTAFLIQKIMQLSERRAAFVSAVTHELRTPLTTFRMYAEMLAEEMVPDEKKRQYAETLRTQADRLSLLVENVLQFARLEQSSSSLPAETATVTAIIARFEDRLIQRASQAGLKFVTEIPDDLGGLSLTTQTAAVEQIVFNLVDNACKYGVPSTTHEIRLVVNRNNTTLTIQIQDDGPGITSAATSKMFRPFHKSDQDAANTAPGVGLGLAISRRLAQSIGGKLNVEPSTTGACFMLSFTNTTAAQQKRVRAISQHLRS